MLHCELIGGQLHEPPREDPSRVLHAVQPLQRLVVCHYDEWFVAQYMLVRPQSMHYGT